MRHLPLFAILCVLLTGCGTEPPPAYPIVVLKPYQVLGDSGMWVFDDGKLGLKREWVLGAPMIIDDMVKGIPDAHQGFRLLLSIGPFPGFTHSLTCLKGDLYKCDQTKETTGLGPKLVVYFGKAPGKLYAKAEALKSP